MKPTRVLEDQRRARVQKFYAVSVRQLVGRRFTLHLDCRICRHNTVLDVADVVRRTGGGFLTLSMLARRARCRCGERNADVLVHDPAIRGDRGWMPHPPLGR
jgi:hypothetical protein